MVQAFLHWEHAGWGAKNKSHSEGTSEVTAVDWAVPGCEGRAECGRQCRAMPDAASPRPVYSRLCLTCQCGKRRKQCSPPSFASDWQLWASFGLLRLLCAVPESWDSHKHHLTGWLSQFTAAFHHQNFAKQPLGLGHYFKSLYEDRALSCTDLGHTSILKKGTAAGRLMHQPRALICKCLAVTFFSCKMGE